MMSRQIKASLLALAIFWGVTAVAQDTTAEVATAEETTAADEADSATDTPATNADDASPSTGRIVFFRAKKMLGGAIVFKVREGDDVLGKLSSGSYFIADVPVGTHTYHVKSEAKDDALVIEVEAGETYYVSASISMGVVAGRGNLSPAEKADFEAAQKKKLKDRTGEKA